MGQVELAHSAWHAPKRAEESIAGGSIYGVMSARSSLAMRFWNFGRSIFAGVRFAQVEWVISAYSAID